MPVGMSPALARALFALLDTAIAALLALAALAFITGGLHLDLEVADISIRSRTRPVAIAAVLMIVRAWAARRAARTPHLPSSDRDRRPANGARFPQSGPAAPARIVLLALVLTAVGYWLAFLTMVCGGSDSYGYVSASGLLLRGSLVEPQPIASWLPVANALDVATPAGYVPSGDRSGIAPMYPLGLPLLMAAMTLVAGASGPYLVAPIAGVVSLILVAGIAVAWQARGSRSSAESGACDRWIGGLAAALVAWNPLMMAYAKQPMSDVPATMWFLAAVWALVRDPARPLAAGLLAGLSFLTRPGGLGSLAALAALAWFGAADRRGSVARFALGFAPWAALQALLQWHLFGSPFQTGYGSLAALYAGQSIADNLAIYATGFLSVHSAWWLAALALAAAAPRRDALVWGLLTMLLGGVAVPVLSALRPLGDAAIHAARHHPARDCRGLGPRVARRGDRPPVPLRGLRRGPGLRDGVRGPQRRVPAAAGGARIA
jgi:hypothetical protein